MRKEISKYTLQDIRIDVGDTEFQKAHNIYRNNQIHHFREHSHGYLAHIQGTELYNVSIKKNSYEYGHCDCYLGQQNVLCKHMIALAIAVIYKHNTSGLELTNIPIDQSTCSNEIREITDPEINYFKEQVRIALTYLKSYTGPSSKWFRYQNSLSKGSCLIMIAISKLPICERSVLLCIDLLKRMDKKLLGPVDDSDGSVSTAMYQIVEVLKLFAKSDKDLKDFIKENLPKSEFFDWKAEFENTI